MADRLGMDPARINRLRSPERLEYFDPGQIWERLQPQSGDAIVDIGTGVGFVALPLAAQFPDCSVIGCDIQPGMIALLLEDAADRGLDNVKGIVMAPNAVDLTDGAADIVVMAQVHHELDEPLLLLTECARILKPGGNIVIVDWKDEDNGKSPAAGRRVPAADILAQLKDAGFTEHKSHDVYEFHNMITALR